MLVIVNDRPRGAQVSLLKKIGEQRCSHFYALKGRFVINWVILLKLSFLCSDFEAPWAYPAELKKKHLKCINISEICRKGPRSCDCGASIWQSCTEHRSNRGNAFQFLQYITCTIINLKERIYVYSSHENESFQYFGTGILK